MNHDAAPCCLIVVAMIVPWKAIGLAALLFTMGSVLVVVGALIKVGYITSEVSMRLLEQPRRPFGYIANTSTPPFRFG